ncbi:MAG: FmdE family protein [Desulfocapsaceae bacterium]|nr:FmdE family protein [Desulfocapsaceae bacterium]
MKGFEEVVQFHGHVCPGLAFGFRVAQAALEAMGERSLDEELVAVVENRSCAVDAIQVMSGCTFGKGNLVLRDYGKQVYTFLKRPQGDGVRISVKWIAPPEDQEMTSYWQRFSQGDRSAEVTRAIKAHKGRKIQAILQADTADLFEIRRVKEQLAEQARVYPSIRCARCGEKVMGPMILMTDDRPFCRPCTEMEKGVKS